MFENFLVFLIEKKQINSFITNTSRDRKKGIKMKKYAIIFLIIILFSWLPGKVQAMPMHAGAHLLIAAPLGEMKDVAKTGMGLGAKFLGTFEMMPWFSIRGDIGYLSYDSKQNLVNYYGAAIYRTIRQEGFQLAIGPQMMYTHNSFRLYAAPMIGYTYFQTVISYPQMAYYYGYSAADTQDSYGAFTWAFSGGFMFDIGLGPLIDVGIKYNHLLDGVRKEVDGREIKSDGSDLTIMLGVVFFSKGI